MTCIAGIIEEDKIWMGCDTLRSSGSAKFRADTKIVKKDKMILGFSGRVRDIQLIRFGFEIPEQPDDMDDYEYMATVFSSAIRERLKEAGASTITKNEETAALRALVGYKGRLYKLDSDFCVMRIENDYFATGSGEYHAMGSLYSTENFYMTSEERITLALKTAEKFINSVGGPFIVEYLDTQ